MADVRTMIEEINEIADKICTEWEYNFMESVTEQFDSKGELSGKQQEVLHRIYKKACESPY